jgi:alkanesulfonate monooxygenase SsuD/methylene tetrahydromethanopterin reductase-like flavin-dependent oxidoreductase (luciferase family)
MTAPDSRPAGLRQRPLGVGLLIPQWEGHFGGRTPRWSDALAVARAAEVVGFDTLWIIDDLLVEVDGKRFGVWECWSWIAALAAATEHIALGTFVCANTHRNPALLVKIADTVDEISGGRLTLGLGSGGGDTQHRAFGFDWEHRFGRFEEGIRIVRELLSTGRSDFRGRWYAHADRDRASCRSWSAQSAPVRACCKRRPATPTSGASCCPGPERATPRASPLCGRRPTRPASESAGTR